MAEAWVYPYTDFGESRGLLPAPILRAVVKVRTVGSAGSFEALIDTGGPVTAVSRQVIADGGGDPISLDRSVQLRLGGRSYEAPLHELSLEVWNPSSGDVPRSWRSAVAVLDPWPHHGTAVILGQAGFLANFTVTFGPEGFALEPGRLFGHRYPSPM